MVPFVMSDDKPYPACKWRQSGGHAKSVHEALLYLIDLFAVHVTIICLHMFWVI